MFRTAYRFLAFAAFAGLISAPLIHAQSMDDRIMSEHVRIRVPLEREWLGRDTIMDLERCWRFMNAATGDSLPRRILLVIDWDGLLTATKYQESSISVGMSRPAAAADTKNFLLHSSAREMARLGLYALSSGATDRSREESEFLVEGMAEILTHEYERSSRSLNGAWIISQLLDKMKLLGLNVQTSWASFSGGRRDLRAASPGITFLTTCRQLYGRERVLKLFESLRKGNLQESLSTAFKTSPVALEEQWLKRVRGYQEVEEVTVTSEEDAPQLLKTVSVPDAGKAGSSLQLRLFVKDGSNDLFAWGVFLKDEASGKVLQAQPASEKGSKYIAVQIPIEAGLQPGQYDYRITAVDESGNVRNWRGKYAVAP
jgi:hypothetical protein